MGTRHTVIGQTGRVVLSDEVIQYKLDKKRTVRYQYQKVNGRFMAWVCGPFHSRTYGACGFGATRARAKATLQRNLANSYGYIGHMMFSDVDDADNVGIVDDRLLDHRIDGRPVTIRELCGSAGM